jgi:hypothetical protein
MKLLICVVCSYLVTSAWESIGHKTILHANKRQASQWNRYGAIGKAMREARFNHLVHHQLHKARSWTRTRVEARMALSDSTVSQLRETEFGTLLHPTLGSIILFSGPPLMLAVPCFLILCPEWTPVGVFIALSPYFMTAYVHPLLHDEEIAYASRSARVFEPLIQATVGKLKAYHAVHHRQPFKNYNLLVGGDQVLSIIARLGRRWKLL